MDYEKAYKQLVEDFGVILNLNTVKESGVISVEDVRKLIPSLAESEDEGKGKAYGIVDELSLPEKCKACIWSPQPSDVHDAGSHRTCYFVGTCNNFDRFRKREG